MKRGVFQQARLGEGQKRLESKAAMAESCVQWKVWMRNSGKTACEDARPSNKSSPSPWLHCHHWEPHPAFPGLCQRWKEGMGADFVTASAGTRSQFWGGCSEWRPGFG